MIKNILISFMLLFLVSCNLNGKTIEEKNLVNFNKDLENIKNDIQNTPIGSKEFENKLDNFENNIGKALESNMNKYQIDKLIEEGDDLKIARDIKYNISIFDDTKDISNIEIKLKDNGFKIGKKENVFGMTMFYVTKKHPVDTKVIKKDEILLNSITNVEWLSYDGWICDKAKK